MHTPSSSTPQPICVVFIIFSEQHFVGISAPLKPRASLLNCFLNEQTILLQNNMEHDDCHSRGCDRLAIHDTDMDNEGSQHQSLHQQKLAILQVIVI